MTEQEAIKYIESHGYISDDVKDMAIKALEEIRQYRALGTVSEIQGIYVEYIMHEPLYKQYHAIGTPDECRAAMEKQIPKKITHPGCFDNEGIRHTWNGINGVPYDLCPNCKTNLCTDGMFGVDKKRMKYCENCGQKLDWE